MVCFGGYGVYGVYGCCIRVRTVILYSNSRHLLVLLLVRLPNPTISCCIITRLHVASTTDTTFRKQKCRSYNTIGIKSLSHTLTPLDAEKPLLGKEGRKEGRKLGE